MSLLARDLFILMDSAIIIRTSKYKFGARATKHEFGARAGKHKFETKAVKHKLGARAGKHKLAAKAGKCKSAARAGKYKLGARARAGDQAKGRGPGNTNPLFIVCLKTLFNKTSYHIKIKYLHYKLLDWFLYERIRTERFFQTGYDNHFLRSSHWELLKRLSEKF